MNTEERIKKQKQLIETMGQHYEKEGMQPVAGRTLALLMVMDKEEFTFDEIIEELQISKSSASVALKFLQLKNIIERLVVMVEEDIISIKHLPSDLKNDLNIDCGPNSIKINNTFDLKTAVNNLEKEIIKNAMEMAETTREISSLIGVSQPTVVRKINKYNLK